MKTGFPECVPRFWKMMMCFDWFVSCFAVRRHSRRKFIVFPRHFVVWEETSLKTTLIDFRWICIIFSQTFYYERPSLSLTCLFIECELRMRRNTENEPIIPIPNPEDTVSFFPKFFPQFEKKIFPNF